jgi:hypothetical protein
LFRGDSLFFPIHANLKVPEIGHILKRGNGGRGRIKTMEYTGIWYENLFFSKKQSKYT